jgi:plasmid maintenance system antidote protein VapI
LNDIIQEKSDISPGMVYRIAQVFGGTTDRWVNLQTKYNLYCVAEWAKNFKLKPYQEQLQTV